MAGTRPVPRAADRRRGATVPEYQAYGEAALADGGADQRGARPRTDWTPSEVELRDDYLGALAAYWLYDVLFVNPSSTA